MFTSPSLDLANVNENLPLLTQSLFSLGLSRKMKAKPVAKAAHRANKPRESLTKAEIGVKLPKAFARRKRGKTSDSIVLKTYLGKRESKREISWRRVVSLFVCLNMHLLQLIYKSLNHLNYPALSIFSPYRILSSKSTHSF